MRPLPRLPLTRLLPCLLGLVAALLPALPSRAGEPHVLVLGRISDDPREQLEQRKRFCALWIESLKQAAGLL